MEFEIAGGSIIGKDHRGTPLSNQDAFHWSMSEKNLAAVVCDGCGSSPHSEVGAMIGARLIAEGIRKILDNFETVEPFDLLERVRRDVLAQIRIMALSMGQSFTQTVTDFFLFTVMGLAISPKFAVTFFVGDGYCAVNGDLVQKGPYPNNTPPYLAYGGLIESGLGSSDSELFKLSVDFMGRPGEVQNILLATDGLRYLISSADENMPGKKEKVGPPDQFWTEDIFFKNPDAIRRRLFLINRELVKPDWKSQVLEKETGWLADDTTIVVVRRKPGKE